ncbi:hypothetical protein TGVAND_252395 [Toxoplasma gondii VAND]|uniref:Uncharacterized protein n=1 Tax=Toxoplasma gondii VAND TaxID=933077 RepID=A0A086Q1E0_TOXGO|nr:hypothetical protein TGVAND_252395 [Toxoplasma gondii VAND]
MMRASAPTFSPQNHSIDNQHHYPPQSVVDSIPSPPCFPLSTVGAPPGTVETSGGRLLERRNAFMETLLLEGNEPFSGIRQRRIRNHRERPSPALRHHNAGFQVPSQAAPFRSGIHYVNPRRPASHIASGRRRKCGTVVPQQTILSGSSICASSLPNYPESCRPIPSDSTEDLRLSTPHGNHALSAVPVASLDDDTPRGSSNSLGRNACPKLHSHRSVSTDEGLTWPLQNKSVVPGVASSALTASPFLTGVTNERKFHCVFPFSCEEPTKGKTSHTANAMTSENGRTQTQRLRHTAALPIASGLTVGDARRFTGGMTSVSTLIPGSAQQASPESPSSAGQGVTSQNATPQGDAEHSKGRCHSSSSFPSRPKEARKSAATSDQSLLPPVRRSVSREKTPSQYLFSLTQNGSSIFPGNAPALAPDTFLKSTRTDKTASDTNSQKIRTNPISDFSVRRFSVPFAGDTSSSPVQSDTPFLDESSCSTVNASPPVSGERTRLVRTGETASFGEREKRLVGTTVTTCASHPSPVDMPRVPSHFRRMGIGASFRMHGEVTANMESGFFAYPPDTPVTERERNEVDAQDSHLPLSVTNTRASDGDVGTCSKPGSRAQPPISPHLFESCAASTNTLPQSQAPHAWGFQEQHLFSPLSTRNVRNSQDQKGQYSTVEGGLSDSPDPVNRWLDGGSSTEEQNNQKTLLRQENRLADQHGAIHFLPAAGVPSFSSSGRQEVPQGPLHYAQSGDFAYCRNLPVLTATSETWDWDSGLQFGQHSRGPARLPAFRDEVNSINDSGTQPDAFEPFLDENREVPEGIFLPGGLWIPSPEEHGPQVETVLPDTGEFMEDTRYRIFVHSQQQPPHSTRSRIRAAPESVFWPQAVCLKLRENRSLLCHPSHTDSEETLRIDGIKDFAFVSHHEHVKESEAENHGDGNQTSSGYYRRQLLQQLSLKKSREAEGERRRNKAARVPCYPRNEGCGSETHALETNTDAVTQCSRPPQTVQHFDSGSPQKAARGKAFLECSRNNATLRTSGGSLCGKAPINLCLQDDGGSGIGDIEPLSRQTEGDKRSQAAAAPKVKQGTWLTPRDMPQQGGSCAQSPKRNDDQKTLGTSSVRYSHTNKRWLKNTQDAFALRSQSNTPKSGIVLSWQSSKALQRSEDRPQEGQLKSLAHAGSTQRGPNGKACFSRLMNIEGNRETRGTNAGVTGENDAHTLFDDSASLAKRPGNFDRNRQHLQKSYRRPLQQHLRYNEEWPRMPLYATAHACLWEYTLCPWCETRSASSSLSSSGSDEGENEAGLALHLCRRPEEAQTHHSATRNSTAVEAGLPASARGDGTPLFRWNISSTAEKKPLSRETDPLGETAANSVDNTAPPATRYSTTSYSSCESPARVWKTFEGKKRSDERKPVSAAKKLERPHFFRPTQPSIHAPATGQNTCVSAASQAMGRDGPRSENAMDVSSSFSVRRHLFRYPRPERNKTCSAGTKVSEQHQSGPYATTAAAPRLRYAAVLGASTSTGIGLLCSPELSLDAGAPLAQMRQTAAPSGLKSPQKKVAAISSTLPKVDSPCDPTRAKTAENEVSAGQTVKHGFRTGRGPSRSVEGGSPGSQKPISLLGKIGQQQRPQRTADSGETSAPPQCAGVAVGHKTTAATNMRKSSQDTLRSSACSSLRSSASAVDSPRSVRATTSPNDGIPVTAQQAKEVWNMRSKELHREGQAENVKEHDLQRNVAGVTGNRPSEQTEMEEVEKECSAPNLGNHPRRDDRPEGEEHSGTPDSKPPPQPELASSAAARVPSTHRRDASMKSSHERLRKTAGDRRSSPSSSVQPLWRQRQSKMK